MTECVKNQQTKSNFFPTTSETLYMIIKHIPAPESSIKKCGYKSAIGLGFPHLF